MRNRLFVGIALSLFLLIPNAVFADEPALSQLHFTVDLGSAGTANLSASVLTREGPPQSGDTVLVVPGFAQTAASFEALGRALFRDEFGHKVSRVVVLDLPGHGASGYASVTPFGFLMTTDYVTAVLKSIEALHTLNIRPTVLIGHSLGGEIVQLAQQRLIGQGSSLAARFGIRGVVLLAPAIPAPVPWLFADSGAAGAILAPYVRFDPVLGPVVDFPPPVWIFVFYATPAGAIPAGAPTPGEAVANGFISLESATLGLEITGLPPFPQRPPVDPGLFGPASGTVAGVVAMGQDTLFLPDEERALYSFLTNDSHMKLFFFVGGPDAVHNLYTFDPQPLLHPIKKILNAAHAVE
jgi:pimeloyl-ACP methyl ester carboxylesterase